MNINVFGLLPKTSGDALLPEVAASTACRKLTGRETENLRYLVAGESNKRIGYALGISERTARNHITSILRKLGSANRTQAAVCAVKRGWVSPEAS